MEEQLTCLLIQVILDGTYLSKIRPHMIDAIEKRPDSMWPSRSIWSYRNTTRVFGTPMMDQAFLKSKGKLNPVLVKDLLETMREAYTEDTLHPSSKARPTHS